MTSAFRKNDNVQKAEVENASDTFDEEKVNRVDELPEKFNKCDYTNDEDDFKNSMRTMKSSFPINTSHDECLHSDDPTANVSWADKCLQSMPKCKVDDIIDERKRKLEKEISSLLDQMENYDKALRKCKDDEKKAQNMDCTIAAEEIYTECKKTRHLEQELRLIRAEILGENFKDKSNDHYCYKTAMNKILDLQSRLDKVRSEATMKDYCLETCRDSMYRTKLSIRNLKGDVKQMEKIANEYSKEIKQIQKGICEEPTGLGTRTTAGFSNFRMASPVDRKEPYSHRAVAGFDSFARRSPKCVESSNKAEKSTKSSNNLSKRLQELRKEKNLISGKFGSHSGQIFSSVPSLTSTEATNESPYELDSEEERLCNVKGFKYFTFDKFELSPTEEYNLCLKSSESFLKAMDPFTDCFTSSKSDDSYSNSKQVARPKPPARVDASEPGSELIATDTIKRTSLSTDSIQSSQKAEKLPNQHFRAGGDADNHFRRVQRSDTKYLQKVERGGFHIYKNKLKKTLSEGSSVQKLNGQRKVRYPSNSIISSEEKSKISKDYKSSTIDENRYESNRCIKAENDTPFTSPMYSDNKSNSVNEISHTMDVRSSTSAKANTFSSSEKQDRIHDVWKARDYSAKHSTIPSLFACKTKQSIDRPFDNVSSNTKSTSLKEQSVAHSNGYFTPSTAKISQLSDELAILRGQNKVLESRLKTESMKLDLKEQEIKTLLSENNAFQQNFNFFSKNQIYSSSVDLIKQISALEDKISKISIQNENTLKDFQDCEKKLNICRKNLEYCMKELNRPVNEVLQLRVPPENANKQQWIQYSKKLYTQLKKSKVTISRHGTLLRIAKKQRHQFMVEIEKLKKKLQDVNAIHKRTENSSSQNQFKHETDVFKKESARMGILIQDLESVNAELRRQNASTICEMQKCKDKLLFYEKQLQVLNELVDNRDMTNDFERIRQEIDQLKDELEEKTAQVEKLAGQLERSNEVIQVYQAELEKYKASNYQSTFSPKFQQGLYKQETFGNMFAGKSALENAEIQFGLTLSQADDQTDVADPDSRHMQYIYRLLQKELKSIIQKGRTKKGLRRNERKLQHIYETIAWLKKIEGYAPLEEICLKNGQNEFNTSSDKQLAKICAKVIKQDIKTLQFKELAYLYYAVYKTATEHSLDCQTAVM